MKRIVMHVDRLLLRGFTRSDAARLATGLRVELQSLLRGDAAVAALSGHENAHVVRAGTVRVAQGSSAAAVGRAAATRIVRGAKS
jgi:hypothetical protein